VKHGPRLHPGLGRELETGLLSLLRLGQEGGVLAHRGEDWAVLLVGDLRSREFFVGERARDGERSAGLVKPLRHDRP